MYNTSKKQLVILAGFNSCKTAIPASYTSFLTPGTGSQGLFLKFTQAIFFSGYLSCSISLLQNLYHHLIEWDHQGLLG